jgi:hypothetical protein
MAMSTHRRSSRRRWCAWRAGCTPSTGTTSGQLVTWARLVQGDDWEQAGAAVGLPHTAAKRRYQRLQDRLRTTVLHRVAELPPGEGAAARRWLDHIGVSTCAGPP